MNPTRTIALLTVILLTAACGGDEPPERDVPAATPSDSTSADVGDYIVHYNAMTTDQLTPEVAKMHGIVRSTARAMLNVSFVDKATNATVEGKVDVSAANLTGQTKNISMRRIQDGEAVYYIGEVPVANRETLIFEIAATPPGRERATTLRFKRQFFTD